MEINSVLLKNSRYVSGGITEVNQNALEWWERANFTSSTTDTVYIIERKFNGRLDQLAALFLGEPRLWWLLAQYNNVLDPVNEITEGAVIYIPSSTRVQELLSGKIGGVQSTRSFRPTIHPIV